jgi:hypothetical protein
MIMNLLKSVMLVTLVMLASASSAQMGGVSISFGCDPENSTGAITLTCAGLEASENGCPEEYYAEGEYCIANDPGALHQSLIRNTCPDDLEMVGAKCVAPDAPTK